LQFDEIVVFSDASDVTDEATSYFCIGLAHLFAFRSKGLVPAKWNKLN
jgi:hypothetical protein